MALRRHWRKFCSNHSRQFCDEVQKVLKTVVRSVIQLCRHETIHDLNQGVHFAEPLERALVEVALGALIVLGEQPLVHLPGYPPTLRLGDSGLSRDVVVLQNGEVGLERDGLLGE